MNPKVLFIAGTHGDEPFGVEAMKTLEQQRSDFDWIVGNPKALEQGIRYCDVDLNRSAPGDASSTAYEERRAYEIIDQSASYQYAIDIHGTIKDTGIFTIVTNPTRENLILAAMLSIDRIVIWPSIVKEQEGPLSEFFPCGLEIECGEKSDPMITQELIQICNTFLDDVASERSNWEQRLSEKKIYQMYGQLSRSACPEGLMLQEFTDVTIDGETFTPIFIGSYDYDDILCYKLTSVSSAQIMQLLS